MKRQGFSIMTVFVASTTKAKIEAIKEAFERKYFAQIRVIQNKVESGVPEQPINEEVYKGAENRLENLKMRVEEEGKKYDFLVACESGLIKQGGHWYNVQYVVIEDKNGKRGHGLSPAYEVPDEYISEILATDMADFLQKHFSGRGGTRVLTQNQYTRKDLIEMATCMALVPIMNADIW